MTTPDSGARKVPALCGHRDVAWMCTRPPGHFGAHAYWRVRDAASQVSLPLSLAQRILAALEAAASDYERLKVYGATPIRAVIAELRSNLPKEQE